MNKHSRLTAPLIICGAVSILLLFALNQIKLVTLFGTTVVVATPPNLFFFAVVQSVWAIAVVHLYKTWKAQPRGV